MKKDIEKIIEIPEGADIEIKDKEIIVKLNEKILSKRFDLPRINIIKENNHLKIISKKATKRESKIIGTVVAHIKNMIKGVQEDFIYKMEICNVHFPMNVKIEGNEVIIKTFLGETIDRHAKILPNVNVEKKGNEIIISSPNKEAAGQTVANIERATKVKKRDRRIFQDGIFLVNRAGKRV